MILKKIIFTTVFSLCAILAAPATLPHAVLSPEESNNDSKEELSVSGSDIISDAMKYIGRPYRRGSAGPRSFDCSGFTSFIYKKNNIFLKRSSREQYGQGISVDKKNLKVGDLVFFSSPRSGRSIGHVGIVSKVDEDGNFSFIHAARGGIKVDNYATSGYYKGRYIGARRVIKE